MYWVEDGGPPIPNTATFDNRRDALAFVQSGIDQAAEQTRLRWIKVFRADNEAYTCFRWENPVPLSLTEVQATIMADTLARAPRRRWWQR